MIILFYLPFNVTEILNPVKILDESDLHLRYNVFPVERDFLGLLEPQSFLVRIPEPELLPSYI